MLTISYVILVHGENEVFELVQYIHINKNPDDKIIILNDPTTPEYEKKLKTLPVKVINHKLNKDYATHRNAAVEQVKTDYAFFIDADEFPHINLLKNLKAVLEANNKPDLIWLPRLNRFKGIRPIHALEQGWTLKGDVVNWPDPQTRIYKNRTGIKFVGVLHERLKTLPHHKIFHLPNSPEWSLLHRKTIDRQIQDGLRYQSSYTPAENSGEVTMKALKE